MALVSPGVEVTIIDQSQYLPAPTNSIPFILLATAANKADPTSTKVAAGTTAANAGKLFQVTSQRDLVTLYGTPFFYTTSNGTPIQGYELNEYGLLAAYSALGVSNRCYVLRADIDLASLVGQTGRPTGDPADGAWWLDTTNTTWGINEWNATTETFTLKSPIVITDSTLLSGGVPVNSVGNIGDYAINAIPSYGVPSAMSAQQYFHKTSNNVWVSLGSMEWLQNIPTVQGTQSPTSLTPGDTITINMQNLAPVTVAVRSAPNNYLSVLAADINSVGVENLSAQVVSGKLQIYASQASQPANQTDFYVTISGTNTILSDLGIDPGLYYQPSVAWGTSAQQPLWGAGQNVPQPTGSVWIKVGTGGFNPVISQWDGLKTVWNPKTTAFAVSDWDVISSLDSTGGKAIPAGSVYAQFAFNSVYNAGPAYYWERIATGPTVVTGTNTNPSFTAGPYNFTVQVSIPGSSNLSSLYVVNLADNSDATDFVTAWSAAGIPFSTAAVLDTGAIQITHTAGGVIIVNDFSTSSGVSQGVMSEAGFVAGATAGCKTGPSNYGLNFTPNAHSSTGSGSGLTLNVQNFMQTYNVEYANFANAGSGYVVGEEVTFLGSTLGGVNGTNDLVVMVNTVSGGGSVTSVLPISGQGALNYTTQLSNWYEFSMTANEGAPVAAPTDFTNWFYSVVDEADIMVNTVNGWRGYRNQPYNFNGLPLPSGAGNTDPNGPIISASMPTTQSDGTSLEYGDLWIDTADLENYPLLYRWQMVNMVDKWVKIDNSNGTDSFGIIFQDARWATNGTTSPVNDPIPTIKSMLTSNYLDLDAPEASLYPVGMMLFNTRRSGYNVKQFRVNYFNADRFPDMSLPVQKDTWLTVSGLQSNGSPFMGRKAQRAVVVKAMREAIDTNTAIRDEDNFFNLLATPNYPELQPNMVALNSDRGETGFILGDTPMRLPDDATAIQAWATNAAGATSTGEDGCVTRNTYMGLYYPSGITADLQGNLVAVPASHMMIRTTLRNDTVAYPWLAAAGTRRGIIDNATNIGYVDAVTGEFQVIKTRIGIRDVLYTNFINPMVFFTGNGLLNYGNKSSYNSQSALDRVNVARLIAYIRRQLTIAARPFVFEPNDALTRQQISGVVQTLMVDLVAKRGLYDYLVVCDESNNTPARIDRNELWIDVAIEPVKAVEFIYIPVRIFNTGTLGGQ